MNLLNSRTMYLNVSLLVVLYLLLLTFFLMLYFKDLREASF